MPDVVLVSMPYAAIEHPSIALGYLSAGLKRRGISVRSVYANVMFAEIIGLKTYFLFSNYYNSDLLGEWTFAKAAFPDFDPDHDTYFKALSLPLEEDKIRYVREQAAPFIDRLCEEILAEKPRIVGCSSMFQQNCASLALLRRIRERAPEVVTVMGGANCESEMGRAIHSSYPWVDYVFSGECDHLFPDFCTRLLAGEDMAAVTADLPASVLTPQTRHLGRDRQVKRETVEELSDLPVPDYDDYFRDLASTGMDKLVMPGLVVETSRGCWWGEKVSCTFCGLNGGCLSYRSKHPDVAWSEIHQMAERYGIRSMAVVDNILDMHYFDTLLPRLAERSFLFLYEIKSNLTRPQVRAMSDAGIRWVQPGIENLQDDMLRTLKKGCSTYHNVRLLKWCREYGIFVVWNYLCDIPNERDEWHADVAELIPLLSHLQAPSAPGSPLRFDRFSAYHGRPTEYGLELKPSWTYRHVYPDDLGYLGDQAYFFETASHDYVNGGQPRPHWHRTREALRDWYRVFVKGVAEELFAEIGEDAPILSMAETEDGSIEIIDTRPCRVAGSHLFEGLAAEVYRLCDAGETVQNLVAKCQALGFVAVTTADIEDVLAQLAATKCLARISGRYLSLAVGTPCRPFAPMSEFPGGRMLLKRAKPQITPDELTIADVFGIT